MGLIRNHKRLNRADYKNVRHICGEVYGTLGDFIACKNLLHQRLSQQYHSIWLTIAFQIGIMILRWWFENNIPPGQVFGDIPDEPDFSQYEVEA